jgi:CDP-diacylglycerol---glycerol-3-phosphate 3-phosphatidyltransferase
MTDLGFTWLTGGVWVVLFAAYAGRVAWFGSFHSARVAGVGGTKLVGENIMNATYWAIEPVVRVLTSAGVTPNAVTWAALVLGFGAGAAAAAGWFGLTCFLVTASTICDILDGQIARAIRRDSARGELLDAIVDRYTEFALIGGFILFARDPVSTGLALAALLASFMISYASAKAEALNAPVPRGLMRRHERAIFLTLGAGLCPLIGPAIHERLPDLPTWSPFLGGLAMVAVIGNVAAVQRFVRIGSLLP